MRVSFKDYFSENAQEYSKFRPQYPSALFAHLASLTDQHLRAWDCATGNGQAAVRLSEYYREVIATDASEEQIANAIKSTGINYRVATAENSHIDRGSIDIVTVAQAFHWFDIDAFATELKRVLTDGGIVAVWTYNLLTVQEDIDELVKHLYSDMLASFWPGERRLVENGYSNIRLPFEEIDSPQLEMSAEWDLGQLVGYLSTWSAVKRYQQKLGVNPVEQVFGDLSGAWGSPESTRSVRWPLSIKLWKKTADHAKAG